MLKFFFYSIMILTTILASCSKNDTVGTNEILDESQTTMESLAIGTAEFTIDNKDNQVFENDILQLTNNSINAVSYHWDFGNGDTSLEKNPEYSYERHGVFNVKLTATDEYGNTEEFSQNITVICLFGGGDHGF